MGIPSFYRWLVDRYPRAVIDAIEESSNGVIDTSSPNPNGIEFDNLYLDMNGIIHPCFHPENLSPPTTYDEVFQAVFKYIDRLFSIVRPRKLLYMAIDGVAPRAKMNQQRARRFRAAKDLADQESATERLLNVPVTHSNEENNKLDSNIITPGTEFMELLASALQYYIHLRMNNDPGWKGIKVIFSGASVPGEGEHKIVSFIRLQRNLPGFDPNTRHCLYGLDADLIMLALATHEVHFTVLREVGQKSQTVDQRKRLRSGNRKPNQGKNFANEFDKCLAEQVFQLVRIWVLRDYLAHELQIPAPNTSTDFERLIDDFVFMCIFVGNDFLPHIPSLEIGEGGIDLLMMTYKQEFVQMGGYLTMSSEVNLRRVEHFIKAIGSYELPIFRKRNLVMEVRGRKGMYSHRSSAEHNCHKTQEKELIKAEDNLTIEKVDFGKDGWKERYYALKFEIENDDKGELIRKDAVNKYVEGICWVMRYYYQGICSWNWFYPYHYAPFASDFQGIGQLEMWFDLGRPLKPFDQLMGVLPAASAQALPFFYRQLMTDSSSPILDFYPKDFEVDLNGKRHSWEGVCKLPFINEFRLLAEIAKVEHTLTDSEVRRNTLGQDVLFIYQTHPLAKIILSFWKEVKDNAKLPDSAVRKEIIDPVLSGGMNGYIYIPEKPICPSEVDSPIGGMVIINNNKVISVFYEVPSSHLHISKLPDGLVLPGKIISKDDVHLPAILWHELTSVMGNRCDRRPKPPNCISGPNLEKMAHKLVSENCGSNGHEVVSEMWQRWLNEKAEQANVDVGLEGKNKNERGKGNKRNRNNYETSMVQSSGGNRKREDEVGKRKRDCRVESLKNPKKCRIDASKRENLQSSNGNRNKNENEREKGNKRNRNNYETSMVQSSGGNRKREDEVGKRKRDCGVESLKNPKKCRIDASKRENLQSSNGNRNKNGIQLPCGNHLEVGEVEGILNHGEGEMREKDGGGVKLTPCQKKNQRRKVAKRKRNNDETSKVQSSSGKSEKNDIQSPCGNHLEVGEVEGILNHGEGEKRENDEVNVTACQKKNQRNINERNINNNDTSKVQSSSGNRKKNDIQSPCGNHLEVGEVEGILSHGEGEKREEDGGEVKLSACQRKKRRRKASRIRRSNGEIVQSSGRNSRRNDIQSPCGNKLEVAEGKENGIDLVKNQSVIERQKTNINNGEINKVLPASGRNGETNQGMVGPERNGATNQVQDASQYEFDMMYLS